MSAPPDLAETATASLGDLAALRAELDRLDDALQDLPDRARSCRRSDRRVGRQGAGRPASGTGGGDHPPAAVPPFGPARASGAGADLAGVAGRNYCDAGPAPHRGLRWHSRLWLNPDGSGALRSPHAGERASPPHRGASRGEDRHGERGRAADAVRERGRTRRLVDRPALPTRRAGKRGFMWWDACRFGRHALKAPRVSRG